MVLAAGVLASGVGASLIRAESSFAGLIPLVITVWTVTEAAAALWPRPLDVAGARNLVSKWVDSDESLAKIEDQLLELRTKEIENRNSQNEARAIHAKRAFRLLVISLIAALLVATLNAYVDSTGVSLVGEISTPGPIPTP